MNTSVNFELAKLLKEKGFDEFTKTWRQHGNGISGDVEGKRDYYNRKGDVYTALPTISEVVMWLYDKHKLWIYVKQGYIWEWYIETIENKPEVKYNDGLENSPTEAYEAAIEYVLKNLLT